MPKNSLQFEGRPPDGQRHDAAALAASLARPASPGHFDELRDPDSELRPAWREFFGAIGPSGFADLDRRAATIARRIRDDGITYNVYSEEGAPQRPWSLDLLPLIVEADEWAAIEQGVVQRAALLAAIMRDVYGPQQLIRDGLLPPAVVLGHPGYMRQLAGCTPAGDAFLHIIAFDLARGPDGRWRVVTQRTQAPSGLGYALQNRLIVSRLFPEAFRALRVQRLASSYRRLLDALLRLSPRDDDPSVPARIVLLTPGPFTETYFEHAYLARYLGIPLVEGSDLTVRDERVYLKTLHGLQRVHAILRRLDDDFCDPLELRPDSTLGVPALLQAVRARQVLIANALGSRFLESPALAGFLPAITQRLLGAELLLPSLDSWWCGERAAFEQIGPRLAELVIKPTYPPRTSRPSSDTIVGNRLDAARAANLLLRIDSDPDAYTAQAYLPFSQMPCWNDHGLTPRAAMLRVYAIVDGSGQWHALPGGLTRIAPPGQRVVSMQRGGSSADTWVRTAGAVDTYSMLPDPLRPEELAARRRPTTSRAAENLFWMGRYAERADHAVRLARAALRILGDDLQAPPAVLNALGALCVRHGLVPEGVPSPAQSIPVFERTLIASLAGGRELHGIVFNLSALARAGSQIRERLSPEHSRLISAAGAAFASECADAHADGAFSSDEAHGALARLAVEIAAITGAQADRMTRDDGWRLLTIGRQVERLSALSLALKQIFEAGAVAFEPGFDLLLALFDSMITFRSLYQRRLEVPPLLDLLVREPANPRALACVVNVLRAEATALAGPDAAALLTRVPAQSDWPSLTELCSVDGAGRFSTLLALITDLQRGAHDLSDRIGERYFSHAVGDYRQLSA